MEIRFDGKIDLNKIADYELLVVSSDPFLSGNGGMDKAVQKKMSETGRLELKNRPKLKYGDVVFAEDSTIVNKGILFAATPPKAKSTINELQECYQNCLRTIEKNLSFDGNHFAAIPLLGTGFLGWSKEESMAAFWGAIMQQSRFDVCGRSATLVVYRGDALFIDETYGNKLELVFLNTPRTWGLRGSPYLWQYMQSHFSGRQIDTVDFLDFIKELEAVYAKACGEPLSERTVYVEQFAHGGMSSGHIDGIWWCTRAIPMICQTLCSLYNRRHPIPTTEIVCSCDYAGDKGRYIIPVSMKNRLEEILAKGMDVGKANCEGKQVLSREQDTSARQYFQRHLPLLQLVNENKKLNILFRNPGKDKDIDQLIHYIDEVLLQDGYSSGVLISDYYLFTKELDMNIAYSCPTIEWARRLTKLQIIACVTYHFRADHFDNGSLMQESVGEGKLLPFFEAYLEKSETDE